MSRGCSDHQSDIFELHGLKIPQAKDPKYLRLHLDRRLNWREHIFKRKQFGIQLDWPLGSKSQLPIENKLLLHKAILKPIWAYGVQLWGKDFKTNTSESLLTHFGTSSILHHDLNVPYVRDEIKRLGQR